jgi:predicted ATPase
LNDRSWRKAAIYTQTVISSCWRAAQATTVAEEHFLRSLDWAHRQGALSWELRTSTSLARLQQDQGRTAEARSLLQRVYDRFSEGFETADLKAAKAHLNFSQ